MHAKVCEYRCTCVLMHTWKFTTRTRNFARMGIPSRSGGGDGDDTGREDDHGIDHHGEDDDGDDNDCDDDDKRWRW